jgi:hypothetical protein
MLHTPAVNYWISVHNTAGKLSDSDHYIIGVKPNYSPKGMLSLDVRHTRIAGTISQPYSYFTNNSDGPVYGYVDLIVDGKIVYTTHAQLFDKGQTQVNLVWKTPSVSQVVSHNVFARVTLYDKSFDTVSSNMILFPGTMTEPLSSQKNIQSISFNNNTIAKAATLYSSFKNDGTQNYQVTAPDGTCVIGTDNSCLVTKSTVGLPGNFKTVTIADQVFRVRYVGMSQGIERFSITSVDPITGLWHVGIIKQGLTSISEPSDVFVKIKYTDTDTSKITLSSR